MPLIRLSPGVCTKTWPLEALVPESHINTFQSPHVTQHYPSCTREQRISYCSRDLPIVSNHTACCNAGLAALQPEGWSLSTEHAAASVYTYTHNNDLEKPPAEARIQSLCLFSLWAREQVTASCDGNFGVNAHSLGNRLNYSHSPKATEEPSEGHDFPVGVGFKPVGVGFKCSIIP